MQIPKVVTKRLILRGCEENDLDAFTDMYGNPDVMRYIGSGQTLTRSESWRLMATILGHWHLRGYGSWAVEERTSGEMVGRVGCWRPEGWLGFEIGWMIRRGFWGKGFATEAGLAAMEFAFEELQQPRVISIVQPENAASRRVAEKLGEKLEGRAEVLGKECVIYAISKEEWENRCL